MFFAFSMSCRSMYSSFWWQISGLPGPKITIGVFNFSRWGPSVANPTVFGVLCVILQNSFMNPDFSSVFSDSTERSVFEIFASNSGSFFLRFSISEFIF